MIRVVLDTNILVSALLQPLGPSAQIFLLALAGAIQLCASGPIYAEYEEVISRPGFKLNQATITVMLQTIREKALWVRPAERIQACSDPDDDIFLECAPAARAPYLIS
jgi:putative PIN family toxin of toxin-antitoxin system